MLMSLKFIWRDLGTPQPAVKIENINLTLLLWQPIFRGCFDKCKSKMQEKFLFLFKLNVRLSNSEIKITIQHLKIDSCTKFWLNMTNFPEQKIVQF